MAVAEPPIETPARIEPCLLDDVEPAIVDLVAALSSASQALESRLHPRPLSRVLGMAWRASSRRWAERAREGRAPYRAVDGQTKILQNVI